MGPNRSHAAGFLGALILVCSACSHQDWRTADRGSAGFAPSPELEKEAVVQVYAARAVSWRGYFGVHSWIAMKEKNADFYFPLSDFSQIN